MVKRVFIVGDTHGRLVIPPPNCDLAVHVGDWINESEALRGYPGRTGPPPIATKMGELFDVVIWGNHEWNLAPLIVPGVSRRRLHMLHPAEHVVTIEGVTIRFSHYIHAIASARPVPPIPDELLPRVYEAYCNKGWQVIVHGHTHRARHDVVRGVHFIDVGDGASGDYCILTLADGEVRVRLLLAK